ncbi:MAG TPA: hypothetical protein VEK11_02180 [Thermoanaerobaculia bacterium]|nr:hypothetical protein [Thermoanaerobaculia bacterium]
MPFFFVPFYQSNDDVAMRLLAEGNLVPETGPLPFLMHVNVVIGALLRVLYGIAPSVPWYDLLLGASMTAAAIVFVRIWLGSRKWFEAAWTIVLALFFLLPVFVHVQFSVAAMACAGAGIVLLVRGRVWWGVALFLWGALIRTEGAALMLIEGGALALPLVMNAEFRPRAKRVAIAAVAAVLLTGVAFGVNQYVYARAEGWEEFHRYNFLRSRVTEYLSLARLTPQNEAELQRRTGWTANDFRLFRYWFFADPELFSFARVQKAEQLLLASAPAPDQTQPSVPKQIYYHTRTYVHELRFVILVLGLFALSWRGRLRLLLYCAWVAFVLATLVFVLHVAAKAPPERILWPMVMFVPVMLALAAQRWGREAQPIVAAIALIVASLFTARSVIALHAKNEQRQIHAAETRGDVEALRSTGATFFLLHAAAFPYEDYWRPLHVEQRPFPFLGLGVSARTPPVQEFLRRSGRTDLPLALCSDPNMLIIARDNLPPMLEQFMREHHAREVRYVPAFAGKRFTAWRCIAPKKTGRESEEPAPRPEQVIPGPSPQDREVH